MVKKAPIPNQWHKYHKLILKRGRGKDILLVNSNCTYLDTIANEEKK